MKINSVYSLDASGILEENMHGEGKNQHAH